MKYRDRVDKTVAVQRLAAKEDISVWEVDQCLDTDLFLEEIPRWASGGPHCPYLLHKMFVHAEAVGWKIYKCRICQGQQLSSPQRDARTEASAIEPVALATSKEEIQRLYHDVYQLRMTHRAVLCPCDMVEEVQREILEMLRGCCWHRQGSTLPEECSETPTCARTARSQAQANFYIQSQATYDNYRNRR